MKQKKIPTLVGLMLVAILMAVVTMAVRITTDTGIQASVSFFPNSVTITNVTETGATVTWMTNKPATGALVLAGDGLVPKTFYDERDLSGKQGKYLAHSISATRLKPDTVYNISILSNGRTYNDVSGNSYRLKTAVAITPVVSGFEPAYGTIGSEANEAVRDAVVYLTLTDAQTLSTLVRDNGSFIIPLNLVRKNDLTGFLPYSERIDATITAKSGIQNAEAITDTLNDSPVPLIIFGKSYDFRKLQAKVTKPLASLPINGTENTKTTDVLGAKTTPVNGKKAKLTVTQPKDGALLISNLPLFQGNGMPLSLIQVALGIKSVTTFSVKVGNDGIWRFTPKTPLEPGKQSLTVTGTNAAGKKEAVTVMFEILKSGTQVLGTATPSGNLVTTPTATIRNTPSPTPITQPTPTTETYPEETPVLTEAVPTATPPVTGSTTTTLLILAISFAFIMSGMILSFL